MVTPDIKYKLYAITIKRLKVGLSDADYYFEYNNLFYEKWKDYKYKFQYLFQEYDEHAILHLHGVIKLPKDFRYLNMKRKGFNVWIKELSNPVGWMRYCSDNYTNNVFEDLVPYEGYEPANLSNIDKLKKALNFREHHAIDAIRDKARYDDMQLWLDEDLHREAVNEERAQAIALHGTSLDKVTE